jgi:polysaccharide export outer membrane protein
MPCFRLSGMVKKVVVRVRWQFALSICCVTFTGCLSCPPCASVSYPIPHELNKANLPPYRIEPPDILLIDAISVVPKPPYHIVPLDSLLLRASGTPPDEPIDGIYAIEPEGTINLGPFYGSVAVAGMTLDQARVAVENLLKKTIKEPKVSVSLAQSRALQLIRGEHLVTPDGSINLGVYGSVPVTGLTLTEAKSAIEQQLTQYLQKPEISLSVAGFNSKVYYVIFDGGGYGQTMYRLPVTGNETVLDAISQLNGLPAVSSLHDIWIARPSPAGKARDQILPVDWVAITDRGATDTNYQILPGDRVHVKADCLITTDNVLAKMLAPVERIFGVTALGTQTLQSVVFFRQQGTRSGTGGGGF